MLKLNKINKREIIIGILLVILIVVIYIFHNRLLEKFSSNNKFIVGKGYEGLGDRWQVLVQLIEYAYHSGRILVLDWRDHMWCNDSEYDFDHYIKVRRNGVKTMSHRDFIEYYKKNVNRLSVTPEVWKGQRLLDPNYKREIYNKEYVMEGSDHALQHICDGNRIDFEENVVVYCGLKGRVHYWDRFKYVKLTDNTKEVLKNSRIIRELYPILREPSGKYMVVHLRGGDRALDTHHKNGSIDKEKYVSDRIDSLIKDKNETNIRNVVLMSDSDYLVDEFNEQLKSKVNKNKEEINVYYSDVLKLDKKVNEIGIHKIPKEILKELNIDKKTILDNNFIDFYILLMSDKIVGDKVSNFSNVARNIQKSTKNRKECSMGLTFK